MSSDLGDEGNAGTRLTPGPDHHRGGRREGRSPRVTAVQDSLRSTKHRQLLHRLSTPPRPRPTAAGLDGDKWREGARWHQDWRQIKV